MITPSGLLHKYLDISGTTGRHFLNPQPSTLNPQPSNLNPQPSIRFRKIPFLHISCMNMELPISTGVAVLFRRLVFAFYGV
jgi:hypothetical protein